MQKFSTQSAVVEALDGLHYLISIHGTGDSAESDTGEKWWQHGSPCTNTLLERFGSENAPTLLPFKWDSANSQTSRVAAGKDLARLVNSLPKTSTISIIAHSHGGNVLLYALSGIKDATKRVRSAVLVGTPPLSERPNWVSWGYLIFGIAVILISLVGSWHLTYVATSHLQSTGWIPFGAENFLGMLVGLIAVVFVTFAVWLSAQPRRFDLAAVPITIGTMAILISLLLVASETVRLSELWLSRGFVLGTAIMSILYLFSSCLVGIACLRRALAAFRRERRKRQKVKELSGRLFALLHSRDEAFGLLQNVSKLRFDLAGSNQMSRTMAGLFASLLLLASLFSIVAGILVTDDSFTPIGQLFVVLLIPLLVFAPAYLVVRTLSAIMGGLAGRWAADRLNRRISTTAITAALGADTEDRVVFDHQVWEEGLTVVPVCPRAEEQMMERACSVASQTAARLVREGLAHRIADGRLMEQIIPMVTFKELMHCGYFENEIVLDEISRLLKCSR